MSTHDIPKVDLLRIAAHAASKAYAPYSKFDVGAAILGKNGQIYGGCNVENVAFPQGTCAEAGAIAAMILDGETEIVALLVLADSPVPVTPCGGCRQKIAEFARPEIPIYLANHAGIQRETSLAEILPLSFTPEHLGTSGANNG